MPSGPRCRRCGGGAVVATPVKGGVSYVCSSCGARWKIRIEPTTTTRRGRLAHGLGDRRYWWAS